MSTDAQSPEKPQPSPALVVGGRDAVWLSGDGVVETLSLAEARERLVGGARPLVCHRKALARRLDAGPVGAMDVLELFAFVRPAAFCLPTPRGLAEALGLELPTTLERQAEALMRAARALLAELRTAESGDKTTIGIAWTMARAGWPWGNPVLTALGGPERLDSRQAGAALKIWHHLPEWEEAPPPPPATNKPVEAVEARARLVQLLGSHAEDREGQRRFASVAAQAFAPRERRDEPHVVVAEAGTGVGKTLGYIAPASLWAEKNGAPVWISTFTRNLQRQLDAELDRLVPDAEEKAERIVVRKGRENYFCLLNFEDAVKGTAGGHGGAQGGAQGGRDPVALGLVARWALASRDGDMVGGDFPAWLADLIGYGAMLDLTDTRGECTYAACPHYGKCFIEHVQRRARYADIVVANHALVMVQAAMGGLGQGDEGHQARLVFDEGHHLMNAADGAFSAHLSGREGADLRRWLLGAEAGGRSRSRGLKARMEDLVAGDADALEALDATLAQARSLPGPGWHQRLAEGRAQGPAEAFLACVRQQVLARDQDGNSPYDLECDPHPTVPGLIEAAAKLEAQLARLAAPMARLVQTLMGLLDRDSDTLDTWSRNRIEAVARSLERRGIGQVAAWRDMLRALANETPEAFVDWFGVERSQGRDVDVGVHRHWVDPMVPFAEQVLAPAHGVLMTSATLLDETVGADETVIDWPAALARTGARHMAAPALTAREPSPFDYARQTRVLVVGDVDKGRPDLVASAFRELFLAAGGGGLGLFTAISRLRNVHKRIAGALDEAGVPLLAQHVDAMDTGTLVDIFRAEEDACLLGTDAVRDGVDVPGRALRLIVFERVPWPRPDILHRARRAEFGGRAWDEAHVRLRLKQAYGRLIRRQGDQGVFVMLDRSLPSRLLSAFPDGIEVQRLGLAEAVAETRSFLEC